MSSINKTKQNTKLSILNLFAAENATMLLAIYVSMVVVEVAVFYILGLEYEPELIEAAVFAARLPIYLVMAVSYVLMCYILSNTLGSKTGKPIYTIQRLLTSENELFRLNWIYNTAAFITYIGFQALAALLMIAIYNAKGFAVGGPQNILMALYRTPFFHSVVPMKNWFLILRNVIYVWSLGVLTAYKSQKSREGVAAYEFYVVAILAGVTFIYDPMGVGNLSLRLRDLFGMIISLIVTLLGLSSAKTHRREKWAHDEFEASINEYRQQDEE